MCTSAPVRQTVNEPRRVGNPYFPRRMPIVVEKDDVAGERVSITAKTRKLVLAGVDRDGGPA